MRCNSGIVRARRSRAPTVSGLTRPISSAAPKVGSAGKEVNRNARLVFALGGVLTWRFDVMSNYLFFLRCNRSSKVKEGANNQSIACSACTSSMECPGEAELTECGWQTWLRKYGDDDPELLDAVHGRREGGAPAAAVLERLTGAGFKLEDGALCYVCRSGFADYALLLCELGAAIDQADCDGATPLLFACWYGRQDCVLLLCERSADINQAGRNGMTPLHAACQEGH